MSEECQGIPCGCETVFPPSPEPPVCEPVLYSDERPSITEKTIAWFSSGATFPAGDYKVEYVNGALKYNPALGWQLNNSAAHGYYITFNGGSSNINAPGDMEEYASQALLEAANAGQFLTFHHSGGKIGVYLFDDPYGDNTGGSPNPTFRLRKVCVIEPPPPPPPDCDCEPENDLSVTGLIAKSPAVGPPEGACGIRSYLGSDRQSVKISLGDDTFYRVQVVLRGICSAHDALSGGVIGTAFGEEGNIRYSTGLLPDGTWNSSAVSNLNVSEANLRLFITAPYQVLELNNKDVSVVPCLSCEAGPMYAFTITKEILIHSEARIYVVARPGPFGGLVNTVCSVDAVAGRPLGVTQIYAGIFAQIDSIETVGAKCLTEAHAGVISGPPEVIDLGSPTKIRAIEYTPLTGGAFAHPPPFVTVEGSDDGVTWTPILSASGAVTYGTPTYDWLFNEPTIFYGTNFVTYRYYRLSQAFDEGTGNFRLLICDSD